MADVIEFNIPVSLANAAPVDVLMQDPPNGAHEVEIVDVRQVTKDGEGGKTTLRFAVSIVGGEAAGMMTQVVVGTDWTKPFNVGHLMNCLTGLHTAEGKFGDPAKIKGITSVAPQTFKGKRAYIIVKPPAEEVSESGKKNFADKNFLTRDQFEAAKKAAALQGNVIPMARASAGASATPGATHTPPAPTSTPAPSSQPAQGLTDLFAQ